MINAKKDLLNEINIASAYIEKVMNDENKGGLKELISDLVRLKMKVIDNALVINPLRGFPRKYAEMYKDYLHPINNVLSNIEKYVDIYLESN